MTFGRKILVGFLTVVTILTGLVAYRITLEAQKMWALGDISTLYNMPCKVKMMYYKTNEADVITMNDEELRVELGPFSKVTIGDSIGVVCDPENKPVTSFDRYYQIIQLSIFSIFLTAIMCVLTACLVGISILDSREERFYLDEDIDGTEFEEYSYIDTEETEENPEYRDYRIVS